MSSAKAGEIAVVAQDRTLAARLCSVQGASRFDWPGLKRALSGPRPPSIVAIGSHAIDRSASDCLIESARLGILPPTIICLLRNDVESFLRAWSVRFIEAEVVPDGHDIKRAIDRVFGMRPSGSYLLERLSVFFNCQRPHVRRVLSHLDTDTTALRDGVREIGARLGLGRTMLFSIFSQAGLPTPNRVQMLFSLDCACMALRRGSTLERAAAISGYSSGRSLRSALKRLNLSPEALAESSDRSFVFDRWLAWTMAHSGRRN